MDILHDQVEENGGLDSLERLQESQSEQIYTQAYRIITQFFTDDDAGEKESHENADPQDNKWSF